MVCVDCECQKERHNAITFPAALTSTFWSKIHHSRMLRFFIKFIPRLSYNVGSVWTCYEYLTELSRSKQHIEKICYTGVYSETSPNNIDRRWAETKLFKKNLPNKGQILDSTGNNWNKCLIRLSTCNVKHIQNNQMDIFIRLSHHNIKFIRYTEQG